MIAGRSRPAPRRSAPGILFGVLILLVGVVPVRAQPAPAAAVLTVAGDIPSGRAFTLAELQALGATQASWSAHGKGPAHPVVGVPLLKVLTAVGFAPGPMGKGVPPAEKRSGYRLVVVASAQDGFQAVFSTAELAESIGKTQVLVIWSLDGKPLPAENGPLRLVSLTDSEPSRSLFQLRRLDVVDLRKVLAQPARR